MNYTQQNGYQVISNTIYTAVTECSCGNCGGGECQGDCCQGPDCSDNDENEQSEDSTNVADFTD